jgi:hypothetical protein
MIKNKNASELKLILKNGSIIQLIGTDHYDSVRGTNPRGCVFSEYAFQNPMAWEVVKPILKVNKGWAVFNTTPNGKNDAYDIYNIALESPDWFCERLTIEDTGVLNEKDMNEERAEGMTEEMIQQEYYCSFDIGALGSYYAGHVNQAREEGRVTFVPTEPNIKVDCWFDLGRNDATAIIFTQTVGKEIRIIDYLEASGKGVDYYLKELDSRKYRYNRLNLPHDATHKRMESNKTIEEQFKEGGYQTNIVDKLEINNGIMAARKLFPRVWFDKGKAHQLVRCLESYHKEWDEKGVTGQMLLDT